MPFYEVRQARQARHCMKHTKHVSTRARKSRQASKHVKHAKLVKPAKHVSRQARHLADSIDGVSFDKDCNLRPMFLFVDSFFNSFPLIEQCSVRNIPIIGTLSPDCLKEFMVPSTSEINEKSFICIKICILSVVISLYCHIFFSTFFCYTKNI